MKKLFISILALVYISTSSGIILHSHYCMGKMVGWGLVSKKSGKCAGCGMEKSATDNHGCCNDESRFVKNNCDQQVHGADIQLVKTEPVITVIPFIETPALHLVSVSQNTAYSHDPPEKNGPAVYLRNCVFLI